MQPSAKLTEPLLISITRNLSLMHTISLLNKNTRKESFRVFILLRGISPAFGGPRPFGQPVDGIRPPSGPRRTFALPNPLECFVFWCNT